MHHAQVDQENYSHPVSIMMGYKYRGGNTAIKLDLYMTISETRSSSTLYSYPYITDDYSTFFSFSFATALLRVQTR